MARIGGARVRRLSSTIVGNTIDVMDFTNPDNPTETINVATLAWERRHLSCALIPNGNNGNPTVAICKYFCHV